MKLKGSFELVKKSKKIKIPLNQLETGINNIGDFFIQCNQNKEVLYVVNKTCDHAGGKLILKGDNAICPMHGWKLNLSNLKYNDSHVEKEKIPYKIEKDTLVLESFKETLYNPFLKDEKDNEVEFRWLNHATIYIKCNGVSLITDPWLFGPAFLTGWWLSKPSTTDAVELLKNVDYIYISHNHPDHLHPETLSIISKDKHIIVADFTSKSCEKYLKSLGFVNVQAVNFKDIFELTKGFDISILKSGDFRDDSGIYICANNHQFLLTVDCNYLNSYVLPENIDVLMTSFAGGASGFPLCYHDYSEIEKTNILKRNKLSSRVSVINHVKSSSPIYYMPYAGMFSEYSERDEYIYHKNIKNSTSDYESIVGKYGVNFISPSKDLIYHIKNRRIETSKINVAFLEKDNCSDYIDLYKKQNIYNATKIINYFKNCTYKAYQILQIVPVDDSFKNCIDDIIYVDFSKNVQEVILEKELIKEKSGFRVMTLYVRAEVFAHVVENMLPWEDFSIGFQMRAHRSPNVYESDFWYYFTNEYIKDENYRHSSNCGACTVINQSPLWNKTLKK